MFKSRYSDRFIEVSLIVISILGIVMIGSASAGESSSQGGFFAIKNMLKQMAFVCIGIVFMVFVRRFFKTSLLKKRILWIGYVVMVISMLVCLLFDEINGAKAWIPIFGVFSFQPSEFAKLFIMLWLAYYLVDLPRAMQISPNLSKENKILLKRRKMVECLIKPLGSSLFLFFICFKLQNDLGTALILLGIIAVCFYSAPDRYYKLFQRQTFTVLCALVIVVILALPVVMNLFEGYQQARFESWLNPLGDPLNTSYQQVNGLIAFAKNGFFGLGLGNSTQKFGYIPEAYNDYISSIIFEELGIFGLTLIVVPYTIIVWRMFHYAFRISDPKAKIILSGIGSYFFFHLFLNLGGVSGLIPMTGIPLLCISAGGSSTLAAFLAVGIAQSMIWRYNKEKAAQQISI